MSSRNTLNYANRFKLGTALKNEWDTYVVARKPSQQTAAQYFSLKLGFPITSNNISAICTDIEKPWPSGYSVSTTNIWKRFHSIAQLTVAVADKIGVPVDDQLRKYVTDGE